MVKTKQHLTNEIFDDLSKLFDDYKPNQYNDLIHNSFFTSLKLNNVYGCYVEYDKNKKRIVKKW